MSQLDDAIAATKASAASMVTRVTADHTDLENQIATLQAQIDAGGATPQNLQDLADLKSMLDGIDVTSPVTLSAAKVQDAVAAAKGAKK